jgi:hypothetical protein
MAFFHFVTGPNNPVAKVLNRITLDRRPGRSEERRGGKEGKL